MVMSTIERQLFITRLIEYFEVMSGEQWERFGHRMAEVIFGEALTHRGQTVSGKPIGYTVDSASGNALRVAEYSSEERYFVDLEKPTNDYEHVRGLHPYVQEVLLLSNRESGPDTLTDVDNWEYEMIQRDGIQLSVLGAREIAEKVADDVISDRYLAERIAPYLEPLQRLEAEFATTNLVPPLPNSAVKRERLESDLRQKLAEERVAVLAGMSGMGKTLAAIAFANDERTKRACIWAADLSIRSIEDLAGIDVANRGIQLPLLGMLKSRPCLLVLDDLRCQGDIDELADALVKHCGADSGVLITSQISASPRFTVEIQFATDSEAQGILNYGVEDPCPEALFPVIVQSAGRLPLALALLNGSAREGIDWKALSHDAARVAELPVSEKATRLADVLLERWRKSIDGGLQVFLWTQEPRVHEGFYRRLATNGVANLIRRLRFSDDSVPDTHRLHDIAWAAVQIANPPVVVNEDRLKRALDSYVRELSTSDAWTLELNHFARLHHSLLRRLVYSRNYEPGHLYAWLHFPGRPALNDLPDPVATAQFAASEPLDTFLVQTAAELAEQFTRIAVSEARRNGAQVDQVKLLLPFETLLAAPNLSVEARFHVRHHRAKALKRLGRYEEAVAECDRLLREAGPLASTRLLIARTLTEGVIKDTKAGARAREILFQLLDEALADSNAVSMSVTLAAAELLRRKVVLPNWADVFARFGKLLKDRIVAANLRGLEQSTLTLASLSADWSRNDPEDFVGVVRAMNIPAAEHIDAEDELTSWGEIFGAMATAEPATGQDHLERALSFLTRCASSYGMTHKANVLTLLNRPKESLRVLDELATLYPQRANDLWVIQRRAEATLATGDPVGALQFSRRVVDQIKVGERHFRYLVEKHALILESAGEQEEAAEFRSRLA